MSREAVKLTRVQALELLREGQAAAKAGKSHLECPYDPAGDATERVRCTAWIRGFRAEQRGDTPS